MVFDAGIAWDHFVPWDDWVDAGVLDGIGTINNIIL